MHPLSGLSKDMQDRVNKAAASPNGPIINCRACRCSAYDGVRHRMGEGLCTVKWYDVYPEPKRSEIIALLKE